MSACNCITLTDDALKEHNMQLGVDFTIDRQSGDVSTSVGIRTEFIEKRRGARAIPLLATFCPFCGVRYSEAVTG